MLRNTPSFSRTHISGAPVPSTAMRYVPAHLCGKACVTATRGLSMLRAAPTRAAVSPVTDSRPRRVRGYLRVIMGDTSSFVNLLQYPLLSSVLSIFSSDKRRPLGGRSRYQPAV